MNDNFGFFYRFRYNVDSVVHEILIQANSVKEALERFRMFTGIRHPVSVTELHK